MFSNCLFLENIENHSILTYLEELGYNPYGEPEITFLARETILKPYLPHCALNEFWNLNS